jgi:hypothetical protein
LTLSEHLVIQNFQVNYCAFISSAYSLKSKFWNNEHCVICTPVNSLVQNMSQCKISAIIMHLIFHRPPITMFREQLSCFTVLQYYPDYILPTCTQWLFSVIKNVRTHSYSQTSPKIHISNCTVCSVVDALFDWDHQICL